MIEGHPVELHLEQFVHRELAAGVGEAHDDAVNRSRADNRRDVLERADDTRVEDRRANPCRVRIDEPDNLNAKLVPALEHLARQCDRGGIRADEEKALARSDMTAHPLEPDSPAEDENDHQGCGNHEDAAADDQRRKPEIEGGQDERC